jgi:hypothetical protein
MLLKSFDLEKINTPFIFYMRGRNQSVINEFKRIYNKQKSIKSSTMESFFKEKEKPLLIIDYDGMSTPFRSLLMNNGCSIIKYPVLIIDTNEKINNQIATHSDYIYSDKQLCNRDLFSFINFQSDIKCMKQFNNVVSSYNNILLDQRNSKEYCITAL